MAPAIGPAERARLVEAFALDAVSALLESRSVARVVVVTDAGAALIPPLRALGADVVIDPGGGLNAAVAAGIAEAETVTGAASPAAATAVAALLGDLPCLRAADVDAALSLAARHPLAVVADAEGSGTTLITALPCRQLVPRFGAGSAARHRAAGHEQLAVEAGSSLRFDVDTESDLAEARLRGLGARTSAALGLIDATARE
jgi:2-phospho-L-lactate guanylyltransferase